MSPDLQHQAPATSAPPPIAVDKRGVAQMFPLSSRAIERLDAAAKMPAGYRIGGRRVWRVDDLRRWAELGFPCRQEFERVVGAAAMAGGAA